MNSFRSVLDIHAFQAAHKNHLGKPLKVDGLWGPQSQWAFEFATLSPLRRAIVERAQKHIGLTEDPPGSNRDPLGLIEDWLDDCRALPGQPWCAAFASHCLGTVRIAGAQALGKHFPPTVSPYPGDVMWYPTEAWKGHCGIVIGATRDEVMTIEGNSDNAVRCVRRKRAGLHFATTVESHIGICPGVVPSVPMAGGGTR
jgi:hypothetical protein